MVQELPIIKVKGTPRERGVAYGEQAAKRIQDTFEFYDRIVFTKSALTATEIRDRAEQVADLIYQFAPDLAEEIQGIAQGAALEPWQLYLLNARTEVLNASVAECTALYFQDSAILGQTWDWIREMEDLVLLLQCEYPDGRSLLTLTEPGILAKVGMNSYGLGVCLNILFSPHSLNGVPVHVLLRAILECSDLDSVRVVLERAGTGRSSHFLVGDDAGNCLGVEFAGGGRADLHAHDGVVLHTNHCLDSDLECMVVPTSTERFQQASGLLEGSKGRDLDMMMEVLSDDGQGNESILCPYHPEATLGGLEVGTCATVIMDLPARRLHLRKGHKKSGDFTSYTVGG